MQYHWLGKHEFCSGASFVPRVGGSHEDDGWIISFVHDEKANTSQASFLCWIYDATISFVILVIEEIYVGIFMFLCYRCI
jgi:carotenoid cleavage dioxygenase-like enzyme